MNYCCSFDHILTYQEFKEWTNNIHEWKTNFVNFWYPKDDALKIKMMEEYKLYCYREALELEYTDRTMIVRRPHRATLEHYYTNAYQSSGARNRMGCSEDWYDCYYAISSTLHWNEVDNLTDEQLDSLVKVVCAVQEALY